MNFYKKKVCVSILLGLFGLSGVLWLCQSVTAIDSDKTMNQRVHNVWQTDEGLWHHAIECIAQTPDGYLWLGTQDGLVRFDGARFTTFTKENSKWIPHNVITSLVTGKDGSFWVGTDGGLTRIKDGIPFLYTTKEGLSDDRIGKIYESKDGNIWVGTHSGLDLFKDGEFTHYGIKDGLLNEHIRGMHEDRQGSLWIGTDGGLNSFKNGKFTAYTIEDGIPTDIVSDIFEDTEGTLWIARFNGLTTFKEGKATNYTTQNGLSNNIIRCVKQDKDGNTWIGTYGGGVNHIKDGKFTPYTAKDGLSDDYVLSLFEDDEGSLWVGTTDGVNRFRDGLVTSYTTKEGLLSDFVRAIYEDKRGNLLVGTEGGLNLFKDGKFTAYAKEFVQTGLSGLFEDNEGNLWIGTNNGLNRIKDGKFTAITTKDGLAHNRVRPILKDEQGSLWIGTDGGLNSFKNGKFTTYTTKDGLAHNTVWAIHKSRDGSLWIGTSLGVSVFKNGKFTNYSAKDGLTDRIVLSFYEDSKGFIWICTSSGGFFRFKDGKITSYTSNNGLPNDTFYQILEDNQGNFWMSCNKGIVRITKQTLNDFAEGKNNILTHTLYGKADGMKNIECNGGAPAGVRTRDGRLWFPTLKGAVVIDPNHVEVVQPPHKVLIEEVFVDGQPINLQERVELSPDKRETAIYYTMPSFISPEKIRFKYKLEGFDTNWVDAGTRRTAYYTNLLPGNYRFRVMASANDSQWTQADNLFAFYVQPRFYQTNWFFALCLGGFGFVVWGGYHLRVRHLKSNEKRLSGLVSERTCELETEVLARTKVEKELLNYKDHLEKLVSKRTAELIETNVQLQQEIKERELIETALRTSEEVFRTLAETVAAAIFIYRGTQNRYVNTMTEVITGYSKDELLDNDILHPVHPDYRELVKTKSAARQGGRQAPARYEVKLLTKTGEERWVDVTAAPIKYQGESAVLITGFDITERKAAEAERIRLEEQLFHIQKLDSIGTLAGGVAHDFNNLLTAITGNTQLAMRGNPDEKLKRRLSEIERAAESAARLTRQLLSFSRRQQLQRRGIDINDTINNFVKMLRRMIGEQIDLQVHLKPELFPVFADPSAIEQVLMNLVVNAADAMPNGGEIIIETDNATIDEDYEKQHPWARAGQYIKLIVSDNGTGMDEATRLHIFEPFFTTKEQGKGTGLGLSVVYGIIRQHNGLINVYSEQGHGTTFSLYLPVAISNKSINLAEKMRPVVRGGIETILLAEDEESLRELAQTLLNEFGYKVLLARNGEEAVEIYKEKKNEIDLVVLDAVMPKMNGMEAYKEIKNQNDLLPIIFMTGYSSELLKNKPFVEQNAVIIQKPFNIERLVRVVREVLDKSKK